MMEWYIFYDESNMNIKPHHPQQICQRTHIHTHISNCYFVIPFVEYLKSFFSARESEKESETDVMVYYYCWNICVINFFFFFLLSSIISMCVLSSFVYLKCVPYTFTYRLLHFDSVHMIFSYILTVRIYTQSRKKKSFFFWWR